MVKLTLCWSGAGAKAGLGKCIIQSTCVETSHVYFYNFDPPATEEGFEGLRCSLSERLVATLSHQKPTEAAFDRAVDEVTELTRKLLGSL